MPSTNIYMTLTERSTKLVPTMSRQTRTPQGSGAVAANNSRRNEIEPRPAAVDRCLESEVYDATRHVKDEEVAKKPNISEATRYQRLP